MNRKVLFVVACLVAVVAFDVWVLWESSQMESRPVLEKNVSGTSLGNVDGFDLREPWTYSEWFKVYKPELRHREDWLLERNVSFRN